MIARALSAIGLVTVKEHEAAHSDLKRRLGEAEDELGVLKDAIQQAEAQADMLRPDAFLWRAARLKRRGNK